MSRARRFLEDLVAQKQPLDELRARDENFRRLIDHHPDALLVYSAGGTIKYVNAAGLTLFGAPEAHALLGQPISSRVHPDYRAIARTRSRDVLENKMVQAREVQFLKLDGSTVEVAVQGIRVPYEQEHAVLIVVNELTERNRAMAALQESEIRFRRLVEESPFGIQIFDPHGTLVQVNKAWQILWDVRAEDVVGTYNALHDPLLDLLGLKTFVEKAFAGEAVDFQEVQYDPSRANMPGRKRWVRAHGYHIRDSRNEIRNVVLLTEDITDRMQAQEQLRQGEARYRTLVEEINDVLFTLDGDGRVTYISPAVERISDYTPDEIVGQPFSTFVYPDDLEAVMDNFHQTLASTLAPSEFRVSRKDGALRYVRTFSRPIFENDQPVGMRGVLIDITERKKSEQEREHLIAELEAKNAELERFTYTVSHDLKSPLVTIRGFLGLLEKDALAGNTERMHRDIKQIYDATAKMQRLLEELLELSRIGRLMNPPEKVSLTDLAREAVDFIGGFLEEHGVAVTIQPDMPLAYGDRVRLREVFQNLIENAAKFMGDQPEPRIEVGAEIRDATIVCSVRDNGMGIAPRYQDKIFDLFERLYAHVEGTGVGLTLVKRIVEVHGGTLQVASDGEGYGSTFSFTLPL